MSEPKRLDRRLCKSAAHLDLVAHKRITGTLREQIWGEATLHLMGGYRLATTLRDSIMRGFDRG